MRGIIRLFRPRWVVYEERLPQGMITRCHTKRGAKKEAESLNRTARMLGYKKHCWSVAHEREFNIRRLPIEAQ